MKKILFALSAFLFLALTPKLTYCSSTVPTTVRVGLESKFKEVDSLKIGNRNISVGIERNGSFQSMLSLSSQAGFTATPSDDSYAKIESAFSDFASAKAYADSLGDKAVAALQEGGYYVYLGGFSSPDLAASHSRALGVPSVSLPSSNQRILISDGTKPLLVFDGTQSKLQLTAADGEAIALLDRRYRGLLEVGRYAGKKLTAVNVIALEEYLYSVVSSEMPMSWHLEALKAQAVASRNYTLTRLGIHKADGYDICDVVHTQAYLGKTNEAPSSTRAVEETKGLTIYYEDKPINASYFSSSGGVTEDSENVWTYKEPYLRSKVEVAEKEHKSWTRSFTLTEIGELLSKNNISIGSPMEVSIKASPNTQRVQELTIKGSAGTKSFNKEEIRTFFSKAQGGSLESRNFIMTNSTVQSVQQSQPTQTSSEPRAFILNKSNAVEESIKGKFAISGNGEVAQLTQYITQSKDGTINLSSQSQSPVTNYSSVSTSTGPVITFVGKGFGHGVGLSQYGAKGMAESGYDFLQILQFYYTGVTIR